MSFLWTVWVYFNTELILLALICYIMILYLLNNWLKLNYTDIIIICAYFFLIMIFIAFSPIIKFEGVYFIFNNYFICSENIILAKNLILILILFYFVMLHNFFNIQKLPIFEYLVLILISVFSILMIIQSNHLFLIFIFIELLNLCIYCLLGINKNSNKGIESAFKYFIQSAFATIIGFFGISLIYFTTGSLFLHELSILVSNIDVNWITIVGIYFIMVSIFFKLGIFPLHSWVPEVYQGSIFISLIFIAIFPKIAYIILFFRLYYEFNIIIKIFCLLFSGISVIYGSIITLYQTSFRRLLAYGSLVHIGLMVFSISLYTIDSIVAGFFYLIIYITLMLFIFAFMLFLFEKNNNEVVVIDDISQISMKISNNFLLSNFFVFILFSLSGLPFFIGFISKWYIFINILNVYNVGTVIIFLCVSILSASYYIRIIRFFFFFQKRDIKSKIYSKIIYDQTLYHLIIILFVLNIFLIFFHNIIYLIILKKIIIWFI
jgi:NADH-quinone oxidoreductase subunit N